MSLSVGEQREALAVFDHSSRQKRSESITMNATASRQGCTQPDGKNEQSQNHCLKSLVGFSWMEISYKPTYINTSKGCARKSAAGTLFRDIPREVQERAGLFVETIIPSKTATLGLLTVPYMCSHRIATKFCSSWRSTTTQSHLLDALSC
jgi:hypothetical protein